MIQFTMISPFYWEDPMRNNAVNMTEQLCRQHCVLYAHEPLTIRSHWYLRRQMLEPNRGSTVVSRKDRVDVLSKRLKVYYPAMLRKSINFLPDSKLYQKLLAADSESYLFGLKQVMLSRNAVQVVLIDNVMFSTSRAREILRPDLLIYYYRDDLTTQPYFRKHGKTEEVKLMQSCDVVFANSSILAEKAGEFAESYNVGQGFDPALFNRNNYSADQIRDRRRIGYVGNITADRLDLGLIESIIMARQEYEFWFIGPMDSVFATSRLRKMENVRFTGVIPATEIPSYLMTFDVAINPQLVNPFTQGNYPRKIDEYLSMGIPVVATRTPAMDMFADHVYLATNMKDWLKGIDLSVSQPPASDYLRDFALLHTWEKQVVKMTGIVRKKLRNKASSFKI